MFGLPRLRKQPGNTAANEPVIGSVRPDSELLLRRLEFTVLRRLDGLLQGDYRTLFRGFGLDLADLREYQLHDDVRYIDWNVTPFADTVRARISGRTRSRGVVVLDLSGSVDFGSQVKRKRELSSELVAVLARLFTRYGNRVGALLHTHRANEMIPARNGRRHVLHVLDRMLRTETAPAGQETNLAELLALAHPMIKRRSVVFVVSDFISKPGWGRPLAMLARRHEVIAVRLYDPMELELPNIGLVVMQDAETGEQIFVDTHDTRFRKRFADAAKQREDTLREGLAEAGVDCLELTTNEPLDQALLRFTQLRKRRSQLAAGVTPSLAHRFAHKRSG